MKTIITLIIITFTLTINAQTKQFYIGFSTNDTVRYYVTEISNKQYKIEDKINNITSYTTTIKMACKYVMDNINKTKYNKIIIFDEESDVLVANKSNSNYYEEYHEGSKYSNIITKGQIYSQLIANLKEFGYIKDKPKSKSKDDLTLNQ